MKHIGTNNKSVTICVMEVRVREATPRIFDMIVIICISSINTAPNHNHVRSFFQFYENQEWVLILSIFALHDCIMVITDGRPNWNKHFSSSHYITWANIELINLRTDFDEKKTESIPLFSITRTAWKKMRIQTNICGELRTAKKKMELY